MSFTLNGRTVELNPKDMVDGLMLDLSMFRYVRISLSSEEALAAYDRVRSHPRHFDGEPGLWACTDTGIQVDLGESPCISYIQCAEDTSTPDLELDDILEIACAVKEFIR